MRYLVYHSKDPSDMVKMLNDDNILKEVNLKNYNMVAMVEALNTNDVFMVTNHIEKPWWENSEIIKHYINTRSTSIGDIIVEFDFKTPAAKAFIVSGLGFKEVKLKGGK